MPKKPTNKVNTAYWCTCATDPTLCLGCAIERLVQQVIGDIGTRHLNNRIYKFKQPEQENGKRNK